jgi:hypothetical protein
MRDTYPVIVLQTGVFQFLQGWAAVKQLPQPIPEEMKAYSTKQITIDIRLF